MPELIEIISSRPSSLFIGAGFSMDAGGPGGHRLIQELKVKFGDFNTNDLFDYLEEKIGIDSDRRKEIEKYLKKYLVNLTPNENQKYLFSIPWKAILTTNYDLIPDRILTSNDGKRDVSCVISENDRIDIRREDKLYCFKLFGDVNKEYPEEGHMILTRSDRRHSISRIYYFYKLFKDLAISGNMIYLGYSFNDNLVLDLLADLQYSLKKIPWKGYAIIPKQPSSDILKKFEKYNIEWVEGTVDQFVKELEQVFTNKPISYIMEDKTIILKNRGLTISKQTQINTRYQIKYLHSELLEPIVDNPKYFFEGKDDSFYPYVKNWDIERKVLTHSYKSKNVPNYQLNSRFFILNRSTKFNATENIKIILLGTAGSGKTVVAKRIAYEWYKEGNPVIFIEPQGYQIDRKSIEGFIEELNINYLKRIELFGDKENALRILLIADNQTIHLKNIIDFYHYLSSKDILVDLLVVDRFSNLPWKKLDEYEFDAVYTINNTLDESDQFKFVNHLKNNVNLDISEEDIIRNLKDEEINNNFFALMYSTIKEVRKPLKDIIID
ncbi:MAG: SIR2 family protein, partial [Candidatus Bathyarchaeota archaeon]